jgi:hypothetical protein
MFNNQLNLLMINKRDKDSSGKEAESERSKVATGRVVPPKPDPLAAPTAAGAIAQPIADRH